MKRTDPSTKYDVYMKKIKQIRQETFTYIYHVTLLSTKAHQSRENIAIRITSVENITYKLCIPINQNYWNM